MRSTPQQSPLISFCPFPMLAAPNGGILPHIDGSGQRHCPMTRSTFWVCSNVPSCKPGTLRTVPVQINFADGINGWPWEKPMRGREFIALISVPLSRGGMRTLVDIGTLQFSRRSSTDYTPVHCRVLAPLTTPPASRPAASMRPGLSARLKEKLSA